MRFTLPYPISVNAMYRAYRNRIILSADGRSYKKTAGMMALRQGIIPVTGEVAIAVNLYRPQRSGDLDNFFKSLFDSISGHGWADDSQVKRIIAERFEDAANPRAEVTVTPLEPQLFVGASLLNNVDADGAAEGVE